MLNGYCVQTLAMLGYDQFKELIIFIRTILRIAHFNHKKYYNEHVRCEKLIENAKKQGVNIRITKPKECLSKSAKWRHCKRIDKSFKWHAECLNLHKYDMKHHWVSYQHCRNHDFFDDNPKLADKKRRDFAKQEKKLWNEYYENPQRITNVMLNATNRRQSYNDVQESRVAVSSQTQTKM